ncbi:hypothetical protein MAUB_14110 [Mycolicibacterium aubagnense]|uniref:Uncharacterized protein n=1 Tax=Mycolicibacterium aubagnense TaxID=319707 RepID=A0ABM7IAA7_9MYCO|nr:hypothetical protein MAUB_14110 [Mycolicibacterium aubagnense]
MLQRQGGVAAREARGFRYFYFRQLVGQLAERYELGIRHPTILGHPGPGRGSNPRFHRMVLVRGGCRG